MKSGFFAVSSGKPNINELTGAVAVSGISEGQAGLGAIGVSDLAKRLFVRFGILPLLLVAVILIFGLSEPRFVSEVNVHNVLRQSTFLMIIAMGQMFVLIAAGMDLSVGATIGLVTVVAGKVMLMFLGPDGANFAPAIALGIAAGMGTAAIVGIVNGFCVAVLRLSPFMTTLGTMTSITGVALMISNGTPIAGIPEDFSLAFSVNAYLGLQAPILATIFLFVVGYIIMHHTTLGRYIYSVGSSARASRLSGISILKIRFASYILCSLFSGVAGILILARTGTGSASIASDYSLQSVAACVIAGVSLFGGTGKITGVLLGALFLTMLNNGMNILQVPAYTQMLVVGIILIVALLADQLRLQILGQRRPD